MNRGNVFSAFTLRGDDGDLSLNPFLGVDHAWISGPTFPPHPHAGFSAVSYLFEDSETTISNQDSKGDQSLIAPGGLHWTAACRGIVHEEVPTESGKWVHMVQIFVNLPANKQSDQPFIVRIKPNEVPEVRLPGARVRVPVGSFGDLKSPLVAPTEVNLIDVELNRDGEIDIPIAAGINSFFLPIEGSFSIMNETFSFDDHTAPILGAWNRDHVVKIKANSGRAKVLVFTGKPLDQPVYWNGPMAMASRTELARAEQAYYGGEFGSL